MTRLPAQPTLSHGDATLNFDRLQGILGLTGAKGQYLKLAVVGTHKIAFGAATLKWSAKGFTATVTVKTGLAGISAFVALPLGAESGATLNAGTAVAGEIPLEIRTPAEHAAATEAFAYWIALE